MAMEGGGERERERERDAEIVLVADSLAPKSWKILERFLYMYGNLRWPIRVTPCRGALWNLGRFSASGVYARHFWSDSWCSTSPVLGSDHAGRKAGPL